MSLKQPVRGSPAIVDSGAAQKNGAVGDIFIVYEVLFVSTGEIRLRLTASTSGFGWDGVFVQWFGLTVTVNGGVTYTIPDDYQYDPPPLEFPTVRWNAQTTVSLSGTVRAYGTDNDGDDQWADKALPGTATTYNMKTVASLTGPLLTTTSGSPVITVTDTTSSSNLLHIKHLGTGRMTIWGLTVDDDSSSLQIPSKGGITLFQTIGGGSTFFIGSYFDGIPTANLGTATGGTTPTSPIVLANITSGNKTVALPNPATFASSYLCICAYTTGTSTTNSLVITTGGYAGETDSSSYSWTSASGPGIGLFLVSNGTKWNIVGIYRGTNSSFDTTVGPYSALTSMIGLSSVNTSDSCTPSITPVADSGVLQLWKTKAITYTNGAVVGGSGSALVINGNYRRIYRNDNSDYSGYMFVTCKVGSGGTPTTFPLAQYPSDN